MKRFKGMSCAVMGSSGNLLGSNLGEVVEAHDVVRTPLFPQIPRKRRRFRPLGVPVAAPQLGPWVAPPPDPRLEHGRDWALGGRGQAVVEAEAAPRRRGHARRPEEAHQGHERDPKSGAGRPARPRERRAGRQAGAQRGHDG